MKGEDESAATGLEIFFWTACPAIFEDILSKVCSSKSFAPRRSTHANSRQRSNGGSFCDEGCRCSREAPAKIGAKMCGAVAVKPTICGSRQAYGGVVDRVWRLGLQARAKAATLARIWDSNQIASIGLGFGTSQPVLQDFLQYNWGKVIEEHSYQISGPMLQYFSNESNS